MWSRRLALGWNRFTLPFRLDRLIAPAARRVWQRLIASGHEAVIVGGAVRDLLLGVRPKDWDLATGASTEEILALFPRGRIIGGARARGTVLVPENGEPYEVTPYRGEGLAGDLARRDFTVNAMALFPDGRLADPMGGLSDLSAGVIRTCGSPGERLAEDPVRVIRAIRLAAALGFTVEPSLAAAIQEMAPRLAGVAPERIGAELSRLMISPRPAWAMERLREWGALVHFAPELLEMVGVVQNRFHAYPVWEHSLMALALVPAELHLRLAALLHDVGKPRCLSVDENGDRHFYRHEQVGAEMADALLERLRFDNATRSKVVHLVRRHLDLHQDGEASDAALRRMIRRIGLEHMDDLIQLRRADRLASGLREGELSPENLQLLKAIRRVLAEDAALKVTDLAVDGRDVMAAFGRGPGPYVGQVLRRLLDEVADEPSHNQRDRLLRRLEELARE